MKSLLAILAASFLYCFATPSWAVNDVYYGAFQVPVTIDVVSTIPTGGQVWCHVEVQAVYSNGGRNYKDQYAAGHALATTTGSNYSCSINLPFYWDSGSTSTSENIAYTVSADVYIVDTANTNPTLAANGFNFLRHGRVVVESSPGNPEFFSLPAGSNGTIVVPTIRLRL